MVDREKYYHLPVRYIQIVCGVQNSCNVAHNTENLQEKHFLKRFSLKVCDVYRPIDSTVSIMVHILYGSPVDVAQS